MSYRAVECSILRGGTSRGVFFRRSVLPDNLGAVERILLHAMGSPDPRQTDGLGGGTSVTSKVAIIGPSARPDADVDYTFAQVGVDRAVVDWGGNCGNISAAVGPYAVDAGLVPAGAGTTIVRIHNTNTGKVIIATVPTEDGRALAEGDHRIPGVPSSGARILLEFVDPGGSATGSLLPTGEPIETTRLRDGRVVTISIVDAANPVVFVRAGDLGLSGTELPVEIVGRLDTMAALEELRSYGAERIGLVVDPADATRITPGLPKVAFVGPPTATLTTEGAVVAADQMDLAARLMSMQAPHRSFAVTGAIATAVAAALPGTVVREAIGGLVPQNGLTEVRIGHPAGVMTVAARIEGGHPMSALVDRTARHIMDGVLWVPDRLMDPGAG